jgi:tetratricopeptide (TPR) repeat protein
MSDFNLSEKFPNLRPIKRPPDLSTVNGCGFGIYGARDHDSETGTYVKTHWFVFFFLPLIAVGAYRVANAERGWYFIGKEPLSRFARFWNWSLLAVVGCLIAGGFLLHHISTPDYKAGKRLDEADEFAKAGQLVKAAQIYREVATGTTSHAGDARTKLKDLLKEPAEKADPAEAGGAFKVAVEPGQQLGEKEILDRGVEIAAGQQDSDPRRAFAVLDAVSQLDAKDKRLAELRQKLLLRLVDLEPNNVEYLSQLALIYEGQQQFAKCEELLAKQRNRLGDSEGARILGQIYASKGEFEKAYDLLSAYAASRLQSLHDAEAAYKSAIQLAEQRIDKELNNRTAVGFNYGKYQNLDKDGQRAMLDDYFTERLKGDTDITAKREALARQSGVISVALDLGTVMVQRAQGMADPKARKQELEKAEKAFLDVQGVAAGSDEYRLGLGQVYYWLGKQAEGRKLFDEFLAAHQRNFESCMAVAHKLREVGTFTEARAVIEEAYKNEKDDAKKKGLAHLRAITPIDLDDKIHWLKLADQNSPEVRATLCTAQGTKLSQEGNMEKAAEQLRQAIDIYDKMPEEAASFNNGALACFALYRATGDNAALVKGGEMLEKAVRLRPSDSILLFNAAAAVEEAALRDVIGPAIDLAALRTIGSLPLLGYLYKDDAGRKEYQERVRSHKGVQKALGWYGRLLVLAPKNEAVYSVLSALYENNGDRAARTRLLKRLDKAALDLSESDKEKLEIYEGKKDEKLRKELTDAIERSREILEAVRKKDNRNVTFAVAATYLVGAKLALEGVGLPVPADEVVSLAEEAHAAAPSWSTQSTLEMALLARASQALEKEEPAYADMVKRAQRVLGSRYLLAVALSREGKARDAALRNKDVKRVLELVLDDRAKFPESPNVWAWAMLRSAHPDEAAKVAKLLAKDADDEIDRKLGMKLSNVDAATAFGHAWSLQAAGKDDQAREVLKKLAARGVPLPFDP